MKESDTECAKRMRRLSLSRRSKWSRNLSVSVGHSLRTVPSLAPWLNSTSLMITLHSLLPRPMLVVVGSAGEPRICDLIMHCTIIADDDHGMTKENSDITMK